MDNNMGRAKFELECLQLIFIYTNSKFNVTWTNVDFECQYMRTHTEEKSYKISNITFTILPFSHKNTFIAILSTLESTSLNEIIRCALKWFFLTQTTQNLEYVNLKYVALNKGMLSNDCKW